MKKLSSLLVALVFTFFQVVPAFAQDAPSPEVDTVTAQADSASTDTVVAEVEEKEEMAENTSPVVEEVDDSKNTFHENVKEKFIEGGADFMTPVLLVLILGLAISIERIIVLSLNTTNSKKLIAEVDSALTNGGLVAAEKVVTTTTGPLASIFAQGIKRSSEGVDMVEKSIIAYGSVEMGKLERGLIWLQLFIALAPMLGFLGTVIGMIQAFDDIQSAGDISPTVVAGGIKVALITTVAGLVVAIILQIFYNYIVSKVDSIVSQMEDASIAFVDLVVKHSLKKA